MSGKEATGVFVAIRDIRFAKGRFALMGAVVALITLLVVLLSGLTAGLGRGNTSAVTGLRADHLVFTAPPDGQKLSFTDSSVPPSVQAAWSEVPGVRRSDPVTVAMGRATAGVGAATGAGTGADSGERTAGIAVFAVPAGSALAPGVEPGRAVVSTRAADALQVTAGDQIEVVGKRLVVGQVSGDDEFSHAPVVWVTHADGAASGRPDDTATFIALTTDPGSVDTGVLEAADARLGTTTLTPSQSLSAIGSYTSENGSLQLMRALLFAISALVIGAFFTVWTVHRGGEIAILKALGASTGYLLKDALGQALMLLVVGSALGAAVAAGLGLGITAAAGAAVPFVLDPTTLLLPALVMIVLGLAGAAVSLRQVTTVDPLTALGSAR